MTRLSRFNLYDGCFYVADFASTHCSSPHTLEFDGDVSMRGLILLKARMLPITGHFGRSSLSRRRAGVHVTRRRRIDGGE